MVVKRSGQREPFDRSKVIAGMQAAGKNRPLSLAALEQIAAEIEESLRLEGQKLPPNRSGSRSSRPSAAATTLLICASRVFTRALRRPMISSERRVCSRS